MVLKGKVRFYGPHDIDRGVLGALEGILQPENSRYWFEGVGDEDAWLLQIAGFPKGRKAARRVPVEPDKRDPNRSNVHFDISGKAAE